MPIAAFIKQSITDPAAYTATGGPWATSMPTDVRVVAHAHPDQRPGRADHLRPDSS